MKRSLLLSLSLIFLLSLSALAQQNVTLIVAGQPGQIPIVQMNGKSYVDVDALARLTNSCLSVKGNQVVLTPADRAARPWGMRMEIALLYPHFTKAQEKEMLEQKLKQLDQEQQAPPQK
jgi:hypothetical protein